MNESNSSPQIWIDADACPREVRELVIKAARRTQTEVTFVANQPQRVPSGPLFEFILVPAGADAADHYIAGHVAPGDLVITADLPLAAAIVGKGARGLSPRGESWTEENVGARLASRNLMDQLRGEGEITSGPAPFDGKQKQAFANGLDRWLTTSGRAKK